MYTFGLEALSFQTGVSLQMASMNSADMLNILSPFESVIQFGGD